MIIQYVRSMATYNPIDWHPVYLHISIWKQKIWCHGQLLFFELSLSQNVNGRNQLLSPTLCLCVFLLFLLLDLDLLTEITFRGSLETFSVSSGLQAPYNK